MLKFGKFGKFQGLLGGSSIVSASNFAMLLQNYFRPLAFRPFSKEPEPKKIVARVKLFDISLSFFFHVLERVQRWIVSRPHPSSWLRPEKTIFLSSKKDKDATKKQLGLI